MKEKIIKGLDYLDNLPPSKWNAAIVLRVKVKFLPMIRSFILGEEPKEEENIMKVAEDLFGNKQE